MQRASVRTSVVCCALLGVGLAVTAGPVAPPAGPVNSTMRTLDQVEPRIIVNDLPGDVSSVHVITEPGSYYLVDDVHGATGLHGIMIASDDVTLDLNGFSVIGATGSLNGIYMLNPTTYRISITNGVVRSWALAGIAALDASGSTYTSLRLSFNLGDGLAVGDGSIVRDVNASHNGGRGIYAQTNSIIESCVAMANASHGVETGSTSVIRNVNTASNGGDGIHSGNSATITGCLSESNTGVGNGIFAGAWAVISECQTLGNASSGVQADVFSIIRDSVSTSNGGDGFAVSDSSEIHGCVAANNGDDGFQFTTACRVLGNIARSNAYGFYDFTTENSAIVLRDNTAAGNVASGFLMGGSGALIAGNTAYANGTNFFYTPGDHQIGEIVTALGTLGAVSPFANFAPVAAPPITENPAKPISPKSPDAE